VRLQLIPKDENFFEIFEKQAATCLRGAELLRKRLENYTGLDMAYTTSKEIHEIEHEGDNLVAECLERLNRTFITPFDREDIFALTRGLDEILDYVDASAERLVILQITTVSPMAAELARIILRCAQEVERGVTLLRRMKDPQPLLQICKTIGTLENDADQVLREALRSLFQDPHFNVMDGLDVYIDDYSKPDPIPESWLSQLNQMARLGAYEEKPAKEPEASAEGAAQAYREGSEAPEKPMDEQGLASPPSPDSSHTPDVVGAPPSMPQ
jgi:predicted phosphate transport protein (TIGR00153 family)